MTEYWPPTTKIVEKPHAEIVALANELLQNPNMYRDILADSGIIRPPSGGYGFITQIGYDMTRIIKDQSCRDPVCRVKDRYIRSCLSSAYDDPCDRTYNQDMYIFHALLATPKRLLPGFEPIRANL